MTKLENELLEFCLGSLFLEGANGQPMDSQSPIGEGTLEWLRKLEEMKRAIRMERSNPEMVLFLRKGYQARMDGIKTWKQAQADAAVRWGQTNVDNAMPLVWEGLKE